MKLLKICIVAAVASLLYYGCENVSNPLDIESNALPPYVQVEDTTAQVLEGDTLDVVFQLPVSPRENVDVTFTVSGSAEYGTDWTTDASGVDADGGTVTIEYVDSVSAQDEYVLDVDFPRDGNIDGEKTLVFTLESAVTESGEDLNVGQGPNEKVQRVSIVDFDQQIPVSTGTYDYEQVDDNGPYSGTGTDITITEPSNPPVVNGTEYPYLISNIGPAAFGSPVQHHISVVGTGVVIAPDTYDDSDPNTPPVFIEGGSYNSETGTLTIDVNYGPDVFDWTITYTPTQ